MQHRRMPARCASAPQPVWKPSRALDAEQAAVLDLASADRYERPPLDCERLGLRLSARRLNLLPHAEAPGAESFFDALFAPVSGAGY